MTLGRLDGDSEGDSLRVPVKDGDPLGVPVKDGDSLGELLGDILGAAVLADALGT